MILSSFIIHPSIPQLHLKLLSNKKGEHYNIITEFKAGEKIGRKNFNWKGEKVGYSALHSWVRRRFGRAKKCEECGSIKNVQWANKDYKYYRDRSDWIELCFKCHRKYDSKNGWGVATKKFKIKNNHKKYE